jgi:mRNA-degrading endonuclease YafQ of YafQ-DinJ toxin-antitoxin module
MRRVSTTTRFERRLKNFSNLHPELIKKVEFVMSALASGRQHAFKVHKLTGRLSGCFAASITRAYRIVFISTAGELWIIE